RPPHAPLRSDLSPQGEVVRRQVLATSVTSPLGERSDCAAIRVRGPTRPECIVMVTQALLRALDRKAIWLIAALVLLAIAVPAGNLLIPEGQPGHVPVYLVTLFGKY